MRNVFWDPRKLMVAWLLALALLPQASLAAKIGGVELPETVSVDGKALVLNGVGLRKATILAVKVYAMGLYLEEKSRDAEAIMASDGSKRIVMHFVRDVGADKLKNAWQEGFEKNYSNAAGIRDEIEAFKASMSDVRKGESIVLDFIGNRVDVRYDDNLKTSVEGEAFQRGLLSVWLGPKPPNKSLKRGVLSIKRKKRTNRR
ncbi:MAG: chalcone isomerase family protein [Candidatus Krumholzibacteriia bacterium]